MTEELQEGYLFERIVDSIFKVVQEISDFYEEDIDNYIGLKTFIIEELAKLLCSN